MTPDARSSEAAYVDFLNELVTFSAEQVRARLYDAYEGCGAPTSSVVCGRSRWLTRAPALLRACAT